MNRRAIGCGLLAAAAFVGTASFAIWRSFAPAECPARLPYQPAAYEAVGATTDEPHLEGIGDPLAPAGSASFGLASWEVWVEPDRVPTASGARLPPRIVLDCGDGRFQAYRRAPS